MASKRMIRRENKRIKLAQHFRVKREELRAKLADPELDIDEKIKIVEQFEKLPRDSSQVRLTKRCKMNGRAHGVISKFGLCRNELRRVAMAGEAPGLVMASW